MPKRILGVAFLTACVLGVGCSTIPPIVRQLKDDPAIIAVTGFYASIGFDPSPTNGMTPLPHIALGHGTSVRLGIHDCAYLSDATGARASVNGSPASLQNATSPTPTPPSGATFTGWSGGGCSGTDPCKVIVSQSQSVTAPFGGASGPPTLTVIKTGNGTVKSDPAGIDCGTTCSAGFTSGTTVTLTATPPSGATFTGWSGGGCSGTDPCKVTVSQSQSVTATFGGR